MIDADALDSTEVDFQVYRIISTRYPQIDLFQKVADAAQWDTLYAVESLTNPRLRDEVGDIQLVAPEDRVFGNGASYIMAPFTHPPRDGQGGRFNRDFGIFYCTPDKEVAIAETSYHRARFLRDSRIDEQTFEMRVLRVYLGPRLLHDIFGIDDADVYHKQDYSHSQTLGATLKAKNSFGLSYQSVRAPGRCFAVMRPIALSNAVHLGYLRYTYRNGEIVSVEPCDDLGRA